MSRREMRETAGVARHVADEAPADVAGVYVPDAVAWPFPVASSGEASDSYGNGYGPPGGYGAAAPGVGESYGSPSAGGPFYVLYPGPAYQAGAATYPASPMPGYPQSGFPPPVNPGAPTAAVAYYPVGVYPSPQVQVQAQAYPPGYPAPYLPAPPLDGVGASRRAPDVGGGDDLPIVQPSALAYRYGDPAEGLVADDPLADGLSGSELAGSGGPGASRHGSASGRARHAGGPEPEVWPAAGVEPSTSATPEAEYAWPPGTYAVPSGAGAGLTSPVPGGLPGVAAGMAPGGAAGVAMPYSWPTPSTGYAPLRPPVPESRAELRREAQRGIRRGVWPEPRPGTWLEPGPDAPTQRRAEPSTPPDPDWSEHRSAEPPIPLWAPEAGFVRWPDSASRAAPGQSPDGLMGSEPALDSWPGDVRPDLTAPADPPAGLTNHDSAGAPYHRGTIMAPADPPAGLMNHPDPAALRAAFPDAPAVGSWGLAVDGAQSVDGVQPGDLGAPDLAAYATSSSADLRLGDDAGGMTASASSAASSVVNGGRDPSRPRRGGAVTVRAGRGPAAASSRIDATIPPYLPDMPASGLDGRPPSFGPLGSGGTSQALTNTEGRPQIDTQAGGHGEDGRPSDVDLTATSSARRTPSVRTPPFGGPRIRWTPGAPGMPGGGESPVEVTMPLRRALPVATAAPGGSTAADMSPGRDSLGADAARPAATIVAGVGPQRIRVASPASAASAAGATGAVGSAGTAGPVEVDAPPVAFPPTGAGAEDHQPAHVGRTTPGRGIQLTPAGHIRPDFSPVPVTGQRGSGAASGSADSLAAASPAGGAHGAARGPVIVEQSSAGSGSSPAAERKSRQSKKKVATAGRAGKPTKKGGPVASPDAASSAERSSRSTAKAGADGQASDRATTRAVGAKAAAGAPAGQVRRRPKARQSRGLTGVFIALGVLFLIVGAAAAAYLLGLFGDLSGVLSLGQGYGGTQASIEASGLW